MRTLSTHLLDVSDASPSSYDPSGRTTPHLNQPPVTRPMSQVAGPSRLGGYQTPSDTTSHPAPISLGKDYPLNSPGWYAAPIPIGSPHRNRSPGARHPVLGEVGPSRSPPIYPATRHHPYPQSQSQRQGWDMNYSHVHGQVKGKGREVPLMTMDNGLATSDVPSRGDCPEVCPNVLRCCASSDMVCKIHIRTPAESPQYQCPSADPRYVRPQQAVTETSMPAQWAPAPQYPTDAIVPGTFRRPPTIREGGSPVNSTPGPIPVNHARPAHLQHQRMQVIVAGSCGSPVYPLTPPTGINSLPGGSPCLPTLSQPKRSPRRVNRNRTPEPLTPAAARVPSPRYVAQQPVLHPYARPASVRQ